MKLDLIGCAIVSWGILKGSQDFFNIFSMASYYKRDVKNDFVYVLHFLSLVSGGQGCVKKDSNFLILAKLAFQQSVL